MTLQERIENLQIMLEVDNNALDRALRNGNRALAHGYVDSIVDMRRQLDDLINSPEYKEMHRR